MEKNDAKDGSGRDPFWELVVRELRRRLGEDWRDATPANVKRTLKEFISDGLIWQEDMRLEETILAMFYANREEQFHGKT